MPRISEPTWTFERAVVAGAVFEVDPTNPNRIVGQLHLIDLDSNERRTISYSRPNLPGTFEEIHLLRLAVSPETTTSGPPVLAIEVAIGLNREMRFLGAKRIGMISVSNLATHPETTFGRSKSFPPPAGEYFRAEVAIVGCPTCENVASLTSRTHRVLADGRVRPSFVCPGCDFHAYVRLADWRDAE